MVSKFTRKILLVSFTAFYVASSLLYSQEIQPVSIGNPASAKADSLFTIEQYSDALPHYQSLVKEYPQDPMFKYKFGICLLKTSRNMPLAIENLKFASEKDVPNLVYFYLAEAHLHNYQFDDAITYYRRFIVNGGSPQITKQYVEQQVNKCENGNFMLKYIYQPKVLAKERVGIHEFYQYINTKSSTGTFVPKPKDLMTSTDRAQNDSSLIFYPYKPIVGDRIYYSSYGPNKSNGKDIYVIELLEDGFWSKPKDLGTVINTPYDEDFPYIASDGVTLYFASKGHYSMGGYDIYRSVYSPVAKQWSSPENLGFPFSSPYDDYLYVPNDDESLACFVTTRNVEAGAVDVVLIAIDENPIRRTITSIDVIHQIAKLDQEGATIPMAVDNQSAPKAAPKPKTASFSAVENDPEYVRTLAKGFAEQMKADTARIQLEKLRQRFDYIETAEQRRRLESEVMAMENKLLDAQRNADTFFAQASQIEQEYLTGKRKPSDKPAATFANDKPQFLYQAQFASTVFQTDELNRLSQTEKLSTQVEVSRKQVLSQKAKMQTVSADDSTDEYQRAYSDYLNSVKGFNRVATGHFDVKKKLYRDCISVAMVKRGATDQIDVRAEIDRANKHFNAATAIRNNASPEALVESEYEALLLDELGIVRLEVAFAKLWGMKLFEQEMLSKIYRLEQDIFGRPLVISPEQEKPKEEKKPEKQESPLLTRTEEDVDTKPILFQPDKEPPFQVLDQSPYNSKNPIPPHLPLPDGVVYKIQLAAFSNPVAISVFKGMYPLSLEPVSGGKVTKYYTGMFITLADAQQALPIVKSKGFKDAFIAAWHNGRSVQLSRAETLEKTEPAIPSTSKVNIQIEKDSQLYMVQIGSYKGRLPDDVSQTVRALAPGKDIVRKPDNQGGFIYSIGTFSSSAEAVRVKDNLVASGLNSAMVIAVELEN